MGPEPADRIVMLQAEPKRIYQRMTGLAFRGLGQLRDLFAHAKPGIEPAVGKLLGFRWRIQGTTEQVAHDEYPPMNRRGALGIREGGQQVRMRNHTRALLGIKGYLPKTRTDILLYPVIIYQSLV